MEIDHVLKEPIEFKGKDSGNVMRRVDRLTLSSKGVPRKFVELERKGLLEPGHELELMIEINRHCAQGIDNETFDRISFDDHEAAMEAMEAAGFFGSNRRKKGAESSPAGETPPT